MSVLLCITALVALAQPAAADPHAQPGRAVVMQAPFPAGPPPRNPAGPPPLNAVGPPPLNPTGPPPLNPTGPQVFVPQTFVSTVGQPIAGSFFCRIHHRGFATEQLFLAHLARFDGVSPQQAAEMTFESGGIIMFPTD